MTVKYLLTATLLLVVSARAEVDPLPVVLSADTEGHVGPCDSCPHQRKLGGLARRATLVAQLRRRHRNLLLVDAGNVLFGRDSLTSHGRVMADAYRVLGYDAINLSYQDFRLGKQITLRSIEQFNLPVVSANLLDAETGQPLVRRFILQSVAGRQVAVIGLTQRPAALDRLPHLQRQLAGLKILDPVTALEPVLTEVHERGADQVLVLYHGSALGLRRLLDRFSTRVQAILVGGCPAHLVPDSRHPIIATASEHGASLTLVQVGSAPTQPIPIDVSPDLQADSSMQEMIARHTSRIPRFP